MDPKNIPDLEYSCPKLIIWLLSGNAKAFINKLIVKPIPHKNDTPSISTRFTLFGREHIFSFRDRYVSKVIPIGLPNKRPNIIPKGTGFDNELRLIESKFISALKKANSGNMINPENVWSFSSKYLAGEWFVSLIDNGIVAARITPAIVVCIPECKMKYHKNNPPNKYILTILTLL